MRKFILFFALMFISGIVFAQTQSEVAVKNPKAASGQITPLVVYPLSALFTATPTYTFTPTYTPTPTYTGTLSPTAWLSYTPTPTYTFTPTYTPTATFTAIPVKVNINSYSQSPIDITYAVTNSVAAGITTTASKISNFSCSCVNYSGSTVAVTIRSAISGGSALDDINSPVTLISGASFSKQYVLGGAATLLLGSAASSVSCKLRGVEYPQ